MYYQFKGKTITGVLSILPENDYRFEDEAADPDAVSFVPLQDDKKQTLREIVEKYSSSKYILVLFISTSFFVAYHL